MRALLPALFVGAAIALSSTWPVYAPGIALGLVVLVLGAACLWPRRETDRAEWLIRTAMQNDVDRRRVVRAFHGVLLPVFCRLGPLVVQRAIEDVLTECSRWLDGVIASEQFLVSCMSLDRLIRSLDGDEKRLAMLVGGLDAYGHWMTADECALEMNSAVRLYADVRGISERKADAIVAQIVEQALTEERKEAA